MKTKTLYQAAAEWLETGQLDWMEAAGYAPASLRHHVARYAYYLGQKQMNPKRARQNAIRYFAENQHVTGGIRRGPLEIYNPKNANDSLCPLMLWYITLSSSQARCLLRHAFFLFQGRRRRTATKQDALTGKGQIVFEWVANPPLVSGGLQILRNKTSF